MKKKLARASIATVCAAFVAALSGCRTPATQIQLFIDTDAPLNRAMTLEVFSFAGAVPATELQQRASAMTLGTITLTRESGGGGSFTPGGSIGVLPPAALQNGRSGGATLWLRARIAATASSPEIRVDRAAAVSFIRGRSGTARVYLPIRCGDRSVGCASVGESECTVSVRCREQNTTCGDLGECVAVDLPVEFPTFDAGIEDSGATMGVDANSGRVDVPNASVVDVVDVVDVSNVPDVPDSMVAPGVFTRPIAPISLADVTLRRPTVRWELPPNTDGAVVDFCRDRACLMLIERICARGTNARPTLDLPARSVVFWRLRATSGTATGTTFSPTWLFHVPARDNSGAIDTSYNPHLDLNGDGLDDVVVGALLAAPGGRMVAGAVSVFHGTVMGIPLLPTRVLEGVAPGDQFGVSVAGAGDVNGDGFGDLVVGAHFADPNAVSDAGSVSVFLGSASGVGPLPNRVIDGSGRRDYFGLIVAGAGDVNADGFGDLIVATKLASPGGRANAGTVSIFHGTAMGVGAAAARVIEGSMPGTNIGAAAASAGDVNGDGFSDLILGSNGDSPGGRAAAGTATLYHGTPLGITVVSARVLEGVLANDSFGSSVASVGDANGDGFADVAVTAPFADPGGRSGAGATSVFHGSVSGVSMIAARVLEGVVAEDGFGSSIASAGDANGDGYGDLVVGAYNADPGGRINAGAATVFHGSVAGVSMIAARVLEGVGTLDTFGHAVSAAGDVDGDGFSDLVVGALLADPGGRLNAGTASIFHGSAMGIGMSPRRVLEGATPEDRFGFSVASAADANQQTHWRAWSVAQLGLGRRSRWVL